MTVKVIKPSDSILVFHPWLVMLINFVFFDCGGFFMLGMLRRGISQLVYVSFFMLLLRIGSALRSNTYGISIIVTFVLLMVWKVFVAIECYQLAEKLGQGREFTEFYHPKFYFLAKLPMQRDEEVLTLPDLSCGNTSHTRIEL